MCVPGQKMMNGFFDDITRMGRGSSHRASSYDISGGNDDSWRFAPGERRVIADISGPGKITHLWFTQSCGDPDFLRKIVLSIRWDGEDNPSVLAPLGDFFCLGHGIVNSYQSLFFNASARKDYVFGGPVGLNCYLPMPFSKGARVELINESGAEVYQYFYVDYELYDEPLAEDILYFHAAFHRENPTVGWGHEIPVNHPLSNIKNLSDRDNYLLLEVEGEGHFIGFNLSVTNLQPDEMNPHENTWWGEGDEMYVIDGEPWPPRIHGTGTEDALNQAYGMQDNAYLYNGSSVYEHKTGGYQTSYVFFPTHPVRFKKSLRASIEHGHANHLSNECASVAYWYQREPHRPIELLPVKKRLPLRRRFCSVEGGETEPTLVEMTGEMVAAKEAWGEI